MPGLFDILPLTEPENMPPADLPYYVAANEGLFLHRKTQIGRAFVPTKEPANLPKLGFSGGLFLWEGERIPATIMAQTLDFFRRIYEKHKTEAEVFITKNMTTGEFRVFVPYQRVGGASVKSVYEHGHIAKDYLIIGTAHSHCMMGAFHSGTDSADASSMDGVHFTFGKVMNEKPEVVAMVAVNGIEFHYKDPNDIADFDDLKADTAPAWWDQYVYPASVNVAKPKSLKGITEAQWDEFRGIVNSFKPKVPKAVTPYTPSSVFSPWDDDWSVSKWITHKTTPYESNHGLLNESKDFNRRYKGRKYPKVRWNQDGSLIRRISAEEENVIENFLDYADEHNLITYFDYERLSKEDSLQAWQAFMVNRLMRHADALRSLGLDTQITVEPLTLKKTEVKGQMALTDILED